MNINLSVPQEVAAQAKLVDARRGTSLSSCFRQQVAREAEKIDHSYVAAIDPETAAAVGSVLPVEAHWNDPRWHALAEKQLR